MSSIQKAIGQTNPPVLHDGIGAVCLRDLSRHFQMPVMLGAFVRSLSLFTQQKLVSERRRGVDLLTISVWKGRVTLWLKPVW